MPRIVLQRLSDHSGRRRRVDPRALLRDQLEPAALALLHA